MHSRWIAGIAAHKSGLLLHPQRIQCKLSDILPDAVPTVSTRFSSNCVPLLMYGGRIGFLPERREEWVSNNIEV